MKSCNYLLQHKCATQEQLNRSTTAGNKKCFQTLFALKALKRNGNILYLSAPFKGIGGLQSK